MGISTLICMAIVAQPPKAIAPAKCGFFGDIENEGLFDPGPSSALSKLKPFSTASSRWVLVRADNQVAYRYGQGQWVIPVKVGAKQTYVKLDELSDADKANPLAKLKDESKFQLAAGDLVYVPRQSEAIVIGRQKGGDVAAYISFDGPSVSLSDVASSLGIDMKKGGDRVEFAVMHQGLEKMGLKGKVDSGEGSRLETFVKTSGPGDKAQINAGDVVVMEGFSKFSDIQWAPGDDSDDSPSPFAGYGYGPVLVAGKASDSVESRIFFFGAVDASAADQAVKSNVLWFARGSEQLPCLAGEREVAIDLSAGRNNVYRWFTTCLKLANPSAIPTSADWVSPSGGSIGFAPRTDFEWAIYVQRNGTQMGLQAYSFAGKRPVNASEWSKGALKSRTDALVTVPRDFGYAVLIGDLAGAGPGSQGIYAIWDQKEFDRQRDPNVKQPCEYLVAPQLFWRSGMAAVKKWTGGKFARVSASVVPLQRYVEQIPSKKVESGVFVLRVPKKNLLPVIDPLLSWEVSHE